MPSGGLVPAQAVACNFTNCSGSVTRLGPEDPQIPWNEYSQHICDLYAVREALYTAIYTLLRIG